MFPGFLFPVTELVFRKTDAAFFASEFAVSFNASETTGSQDIPDHRKIGGIEVLL